MAKILILDPSQVYRKRMRSIVEAAGHSAVEAESPTEAMAGVLRQATAVDLILTELQFPGESGFQFLRWVKSQELLRRTPVLVVTAQPSRDAVIEMVNAGARTIVTKPFGPDLLLRRVTESLAEQALQRQGGDAGLAWDLGDYLRRELKRVERRHLQFSLLLCRMLEPAPEEAVLQWMGRLMQVLREYDVMTKLGEGEVVILLPDTDRAGAASVQGRVGQVVRELAERPLEERPIQMRIAVGAATFPGEAPDGYGLLSLARERSLAWEEAP